MHITWTLLQIFDVGVYRFNLVNRHAPLDASMDGVQFVLGEVVSGLGTYQNKDLL